MISFPPCKINLGLHILSKRRDGYHTIETCFYPLPLTDILEILPSNGFSFSSSGLEVPGKMEDNLCWKAYHLLKEDCAIGPVKIHLHKIIPTGAGLGGGSSDAAFTLRMINQAFNLNLPVERLKNYALQLGSDCPFFIEEGARFAEGRGEILTPAEVNLKGYYLVLIKPDVHISTAEAYVGASLTKPDNPIKEILKRPVTDWKNKLKNDFEESIFKKYPVIAAIKSKLYSKGAIYASMSGSGASVYSIFEKPVNLKSSFGGMYYWSGELK